MNKLLLCGALGAHGLLPLAAHADFNANDRLDTVVVVANRQPVPLREVTASVSVMTEKDIEERGQASLIDVLRSLPSVSVSNTGGAGKLSSLSIRGEDGYRTRVLIDGIETLDPQGAQATTQLQHFLSSGIERVELLRGPQGMMYGADAGGVLNIVTVHGREPFAADVAAEVGRYGTHNLYGNIRGKNDRLDYSLSLAGYATEGFNTSAFDTTLRDNDGYRNNTVHFNGGVQVTDVLRVEATVRDILSHNDYDGCYKPVTNDPTDRCRSDYDQLSYRLGALLDGQNLQQSLYVQRSDIKKRDLVMGISTGDTNGHEEKAQYQGIWKIEAAGDVVYGTDFEKQRYSTPYDERESRNQLGYYLEWQGHLDNRFFYTAGARHDRNDDFGEHTSYRASAAYLFDLSNGDVLKLKSSYGTGFRAPSLYEAAYNSSPAAFEPASKVRLKEETSRGIDAGFEYHWQQGANLEVVYFDQKIDDLIYFDPVARPPSYWSSGYLQDAGSSRSHGVEASGEYPINDQLRLSANYTYNDAHDPAGERRVRRPRHIANLGGVFSPIAPLTISANLRLVRDVLDAEFGMPSMHLDNYNLLDANISWAFNPSLEVYVRGENLLNDDYQEALGYNTAGRAFYTGLRYHFR